MKRAMILATMVLSLAACGDRKAARSPAMADDFALDTAPIALPADMASLPQTPGGTLVTQSCTGCHSPEMILSQPPLGADKWKAEIEKMRGVFHAPIDPADDAGLVAALVSLQATSHPASPGGAHR